MHGNNLRQYREQIKGMTQVKLAKMVGLTENGYQKLEYGKTKPRYDTVRKLASILGATESDLFPLPEDNEQENAETEGGCKIRKNLKEARVMCGLTQKEVAKHLGMSETSYQRIEAGTRGSSESNWLKLYSMFECKVPLHELMETTSLDSLSGVEACKEN